MFHRCIPCSLPSLLCSTCEAGEQVGDKHSEAWPVWTEARSCDSSAAPHPNALRGLVANHQAAAVAAGARPYQDDRLAPASRLEVLVLEEGGQPVQRHGVALLGVRCGRGVGRVKGGGGGVGATKRRMSCRAGDHFCCIKRLGCQRQLARVAEPW